ncbi:MAG TPA: YceH family protein [Terriglobales bacterium]|nr:YceH family protein [Terriglobales bacterium]
MELPWVLEPNEARVLGSLLEKESTTPEYYPLSLNALINACNQKSNRDPVLELEEEDVRRALHRLQEKLLVRVSTDGRVAKYRHQLQEALNLTRGQTALLCVLLLRGAQTPGELRGRTDRLYNFAELDDAHAALQQLIQHDPPLAAALPRAPGTKEIRYVQLLTGAPAAAAASAADTSPREGLGDRVARLEEELDAIRQRVAQLEAATRRAY